ncbi:MAG: bifunctional diguanylate cyclase/phosphodiesterase [Synergistaceae bacterium]|nr:bifunctional diguanylate cyclase/phosphodiesterase [Synergistaceae bacterium]
MPELDELTGLFTRKSFHEQAGKILRSYNGLAVVWLNLDNFKMFNERFGFDRGDELLRETAGIISTIFSRDAYQNNISARFSDDNFVILTDWANAEMNTEMIQQYLCENHEDVSLRLRAGIYFPSEHEDIRSSCDRAKLACDSIRKNHSVNSCMFHEGMSHKLELQQYILDTLDMAMKNGYIQVLYQPIVRLSDGKISETEALTRWNDPERGNISPAEFIPTLEHYREIHKLDIHALRHVCNDYKLRMKRNLPLVPVSINLSRLDFELCNIFQEVEHALRVNNIPREMIRIEITESINEDDTSVLNLGIEKFRAMGYQVWMDDFGSGYSSLNVLKDYNFDTIKFDMKFLHGFDINKSDKAKYIISSNLSMARLMGMQALAEGVENAGQLEYLQSIGFDKGQGYYFGRPMRLEEIFTLGREVEAVKLC